MGTEFRITISAADTSGMQRTIDSAFRRVDELEQMMSDYRAGSELNRLRGSTKWQQISPELHEVLVFSRALAKQTRGAFDPTIGPLTKLWRRAFRQQAFPAEDRILAARARVHWKDLRVAKRRRVRLRRKEMSLDLGGVAKGFALDEVGKLLRKAGFPAFLLDGGGDLLLGDAPSDEGWTVKFPASGSVSDLYNVAIATSGDAYRYLEWEGVRYSHIIDPRTGYGTTHQREVTVFGPSAMVADGLASAYLLGSQPKGFPDYTYSDGGR
ncbi:MAG: thiamine biosynthesis lipoprotein [Neolewinella sp.]|jgi:thiamine biosynthesis lipoprotein